MIIVRKLLLTWALTMMSMMHSKQLSVEQHLGIRARKRRKNGREMRIILNMNPMINTVKLVMPWILDFLLR